MGASGVGPFENDFADDLCDEVRDSDGDEVIALLRAALQNAVDTPFEDYLERDIGEAAVAAAAIAVAQRLGREDVLEEADLSSKVPPVPDDIFPLAVAALERTRQGDSEVRRLWEDVNAEQEWLQVITALETDAKSLSR